MSVLLVAHAVAALLAPWLVRLLGRRAFAALALVPLAGFAWVLAQTGAVQDGGVAESWEWVPTLGIELAFHMGALQWLLALVVTGIGALVLAYCTWYFHDDDPGLSTFAGVFVAFAGSMLGLVLCDDLMVLYVFWELTTVFSFLLIGIDPARRASRQAAMQALLVTTLGGLAMLVGMLMLGHQAGTLRISELVADPPAAGTATAVAVALVLVGALSKSALVPFHFWLPGAMAAPTPVSAYLHAASMVKAGVYLVALLAPGFAGVAGWHEVILTLGVATMLLGGWRALRQYDAKLLLAYGTVSQLGFLLVVLSIGTRAAALAGVAMLLAHALFKATLFLVVGIVDHQAGTRDIRVLSGVGRQAPVLAAAAVLGGAAMAGMPPLLGFVGKEGIFTALLDVADAGDRPDIAPWAGWLVLAGVVLGSLLTVAYTLRFLWGVLGTKRDVALIDFPAPAAGFLAAPVLLAVASAVLGFAGAPLTELVAPYAEQFPAGVHASELALWHGWKPALALSALALAGGAALFAARARFGALQTRLAMPYSADGSYRLVMRSVDRLAVELTSLTQSGSVAVYLVVILMVVVLLPGTAALMALDSPIDAVLWDTPTQAVVGVVIALAAIFAVRSRRRLRAVILTGVTGYGTALLFLLHGAPDLALTQVLVETTSLVVFVLVLRRLPEYFTDRPLSARRYLRMLLGAAVGGVVAVVMLIATGSRSADPVSTAYPEEAVEFGGGHNIVNVILVDIRAWDTLGEISVLVAAATGVASLLFLDTRLSGIRRVHDIPYPATVEKVPTGPGRRVWLPGPRTLPPDRRSIIFEVVTRLLFPVLIVFGIYLLLAGHNLPGGGFAAGMVTGLALMVRYLAGGRYELDEAAPVDAGILMGAGLFVAGVAGLAPLAFGGAVLQSAKIDLALPLLGELHLVSSTIFDIGVYLVVVGLVLDLLRALGARIDRQILREEREAATAAADGSDKEGALA
ncbi:Na+/H+ antiporter subunit A [Nocardioides sp. zg-ZUI104]|uniref:Na+/H+ antiporter subunit A n=1 Tax=Nocardioides faecalis TaxID=2803858 RepID=UPI001BCA8498|nr:Na+/H+ antiporter subunit A [Nocardioides faecalis]MBS4754260.1 Na+/H+ antiporter subunit A [Nocardioides faecalis]